MSEVEVYPDGCPDAIEKYVFDVIVVRPDPDAVKLADQKTGEVRATYQGRKAGTLWYGFLLGKIAITLVETEPEFHCRGCMTQMGLALMKAFPGIEIVDGGNSNSKVGDALVEKLQGRGLLG